ncbi:MULTISPECIES: hypothetical protein [Sinorhizobium]|uniref:hypothetical protein n=1 Tax=Sinorhizobium TaxID=28105 RepID=UPI001F461E40|nr:MULTISPECIES: hypothetical protein [Sinorhizobium]
MFEAAMATSGLQFAVSAEGLFRHANGAVLSMTLIPASIDTLIGELAQLLGVPKPMSDVFACRNPSCKLCAIEAKAQFAATDATQH